MRCCGTMRETANSPGAGSRCDAHRNRANYCSEITEDQKEYVDAVNAGKVGDLLEFLTAQAQRRPLQAMCNVNSGFLVKAVRSFRLPTISSRFVRPAVARITEPSRWSLCWSGSGVRSKKNFSRTIRAFISCSETFRRRAGAAFASAGGKRGHMSHMSGQDADIGFVTPMKNKPSPDTLHKNLQPKPNWWFLKQALS